ncbi:MAG: type I DNA topoisomerase [bacterium]
MKLVIVESPAKGKTIEKYLGPGHKVMASFGHVRDLPKSNKDAVDIEHGFKPKYIITPRGKKIISDLRAVAVKADQVLLATDPDREGEAISWHLAQALKLKESDYDRIEFHEITKSAVEHAANNPRKINIDLVDAQQARRVLDRLVGYDLSGVIWKKVRYGLSAGRVQSPALRIIMERERERRAFVSEDFWTLVAETKTLGKDNLSLTCTEEPKNIERLTEIETVAKNGQWIVANVTSTEAKRAPKPPFTTSTLQQTASTRLGFSPSRTMGVAQKLYEAGLISYMRTDSTNLSETALEQINQVVTSKYGKEYLSPHKYKTTSKNAQEAHEAIRPTNFEHDNAGHNDEQKKLYKLIWGRTVASQMADAKLLRSKITAKYYDDNKFPLFTANGSHQLFAGWLSADPAVAGEEVNLPKVNIGDELTLIDFVTTAKQTEPPTRYTEAGLIKELEKRGIGRPSTYASIMKTLEDRGYVTKEGRTLIPTDTGDVVSTFLEKYFAEYISDTFTAEMEDELDLIANGKAKYVQILSEFYGPFIKKVKTELKEPVKPEPADPKFKCPKCKSSMIIKLGKNGKFLSCSKYPECQGALTMEGEEMEGPKPIGEPCPECGGDLIEREGKYGKFISCSNYPKCKYIRKDETAVIDNGTGVKCPVCKKGEMAERKGRFGIFYSCNNYPKCKYAIKAKPTGNICKECGSLMMEGTKTIPERCSSKDCPNHNPHKNV